MRSRRSVTRRATHGVFREHLVRSFLADDDGLGGIRRQWDLARDLSAPDLKVVEDRLSEFAVSNSDHPLSGVIRDYLEATASPAG